MYFTVSADCHMSICLFAFSLLIDVKDILKFVETINNSNIQCSYIVQQTHEVVNCTINTTSTYNTIFNKEALKC